MTVIATPVVSVRFDENPHDWRTFFDLHRSDVLVDAIVTAPTVDTPAQVRGHREIHLGNTPYDPSRAELGRMMLVAVSDGQGAVYFRDLDSEGRPVGYVARGDGDADRPGLPFDSQGSVEFEPEDAMNTDRVRAIGRDYLLTGTRPDIVTWRESEWVQ